MARDLARYQCIGHRRRRSDIGTRGNHYGRYTVRCIDRFSRHLELLRCPLRIGLGCDHHRFDPLCTTHLPGTGDPAGPGIAESRDAFQETGERQVIEPNLKNWKNCSTKR
ncbi:MAG: hypothetical protein RLZZ396_609 [Planctomycetota bacterium]